METRPVSTRRDKKQIRPVSKTPLGKPLTHTVQHLGGHSTEPAYLQLSWAEDCWVDFRTPGYVWPELKIAGWISEHWICLTWAEDCWVDFRTPDYRYVELSWRLLGGFQNTGLPICWAELKIAGWISEHWICWAGLVDGFHLAEHLNKVNWAELKISGAAGRNSWRN